MADNNGKIEYRKAIVTFIDILGFKDLIEKNANNPEKIHDIVEWSSAFGTFNGCTNELSGNYSVYIKELDADFHAIMFSDTIVRIYFPKANNNSETLCIEYELSHFSGAQQELLDKKILFRGAITIGDIFFEPKTNIIFGPAMNRAHKLESELAIYPRIILDPEKIEDFKKTEKFDIYINTDFDGMKYVDYFDENGMKKILDILTKTNFNDNNAFNQFKIFVNSIINLQIYISEYIIKQITDKKLPEKVIAKHAWVLNHYNASIDNVIKTAKLINYKGVLPEKINVDLYSEPSELLEKMLEKRNLIFKKLQSSLDKKEESATP